eukprot:349850-Chlamydomonas_euryale.AAC.5
MYGCGHACAGADMYVRVWTCVYGCGHACTAADMWRDRALAALRPVLMSRLPGSGWYGVAQDLPQWRALCDSALTAA